MTCSKVRYSTKHECDESNWSSHRHVLKPNHIELNRQIEMNQTRFVQGLPHGLAVQRLAKKGSQPVVRGSEMQEGQEASRIQVKTIMKRIDNETNTKQQ